jgi:hypothetical protein
MVEWYIFVPGLLILLITFILSVIGVLGINLISFFILVFYNYYFYDSFLSIWIIIVIFLFSLGSEYIDFFSGPIGAKIGGSNKKAVKLAVTVLIIFTVVSLITFQLYLIPLSFFIALIIGEIYYNKDWTIIGILKSVISICLVKGVGLLIKICISLVILLYYIYVYIKI